MKQIVLNILGFLAYTLPKWCCKPGLMYSFWLRKRNSIHMYGDWDPKRCSIFTYIWMADQSNVMWRTWRGFIIKGADKLLDKEDALEWCRGYQGTNITGKISEFYRREK